MTQGLLSKWRVWLLIIALAIAVFGIFGVGLTYGIDFKGGTSFQVKLAKEVSSSAEKEQIRSIIEQRLNFTGLRDAAVTFAGNDLLVADIAETDPAQVQQLEDLLLRQGKFEATLDGQVLFTGNDFVQISKDPSRGYGLRSGSNGQYEWSLPFILKPSAAKRFADMTFHQCDLIGTGTDGKPNYECKYTYFFIDRPEDSVVILPSDVRILDDELFNTGSAVTEIPAGTKLDDLIENSGVPFAEIDENNPDQNAAGQLAALAAKNPTAIIPPSLSPKTRTWLTGLGFTLHEVAAPEGVPFSWQATGAREIIRLNPSVTNLDPYVADQKDAKVLSDLQIQGSGKDQTDAQKKLDSLTILLQSGSLPIAVRDISKETISPLLGKQFLDAAILMGLLAIALVLIIMTIRYRRIELAVPLAVTSISEALLILGFAAFAKWNLDLASMAGIIAAIGTGVDSQIVITDELLKGIQAQTGSMLERTKRALFIIAASASTMLATMLPVIFFGFGLGKLVGFALTTTIGVILGLLITRPAYSEFANYLLSKPKKE